MDEQIPPASPQLLAANRRLYELRAQAQAAKQPAGGPAPVALWADPPQRPDDARALVQRIAALPAHLGWGSTALTAVIRRQQGRTAGGLSRAAWPAVARSAAAQPRDSDRAAIEPESIAVEDAGSLGKDSRRDQVKLYPDIGLGMLRQEQTAAGRLWLLLRYLDRAGQGALRIVSTKQILTTPTSTHFLCSRRQLRNLLQAGEGIFWTRDNERIWLRSAARVAHALGVERLTGRPVALPLSALLNGIGTFRAHLYAAFHSARTKETAHGSQAMPISRTALAELSGVGGSSQRVYEARAGVEVQTNYAVGETATKEAKENHAWRHGRALFELKDHRGRQGRAGQTYLAWQLPNSYLGAHAQLPKGRQKRINRKLRDLVHQGTPGNVEPPVDRPMPTKRYYPNGKLATKAAGRDVDRRRYWRGQRSRDSRHDIWQQVACAGGWA